MRPTTERVALRLPLLSGAAKKSVGEEARVGRGAVGNIHHRKREGDEAAAASMPMQTEAPEVVGDSSSKAIRITP